MSPSAALHDPAFRVYVVMTLGVLVSAGILLALVQFVFRIELGSVWKTYRSWLVMAPVVALVIFAGRVPFIIGVTVVSLLAGQEFARVSGLASDRWMTGVLYSAIFLTALGCAPIFVLALFFLLPTLRNRVDGELRSMSLGVVALVLLGWMFGQLGFFASSPNAYGYLCYLIFATEVTDVSAFAFGKMFGRHPLRSEISPRKTWEGALGALAVALALPWLLRFSFPFFGTGQLILAGAIVGVGGPLGDLSLSVIKRDLGAKDWGAAIPGHGGVLDRIDSLIFVVPLFMQMTEYYYPGR
jgi:phosphatidate cytidylyltransferase